MNFDQFQPTDVGSCGEPYTVLAACATLGRPARARLLRRRPRGPAAAARPVERRARPRVRRALRVPLGPLQLRDHGLLRLPGLPVRRGRLRLQPQRRPAHRPPAAQRVDRQVQDRQGVGVPRRGQRAQRALGEPAALRDGLREHGRHLADARPGRVLRQRVRQPAPHARRAARRARRRASSPRSTSRCAATPTPVWSPRARSSRRSASFPRTAACRRRSSATRTTGAAEGDRQPEHRPERRRQPRLRERLGGQPDRRRGRLRAARSTSTTPAGIVQGSLSGRLTDWQEALLGCGPFYHTSCDLDGLDLLNAEASALDPVVPEHRRHVPRRRLRAGTRPTATSRSPAPRLRGRAALHALRPTGRRYDHPGLPRPRRRGLQRRAGRHASAQRSIPSPASSCRTSSASSPGTC